MKALKLEESGLVRLAGQGDLSMFNNLVLQYQDQVFNHAYRLLEDYDAAEDITQDAFLLVFRKFYQFRGGSLRAWLLKIVANRCYDQMQSWKRVCLEVLEPINQDGEINESPYWIKDSKMLPEESIEVRELREGIERGLRKLSVKFRSAVILVDIEELSYQEAAFVMSTSIGTLKSRLARGRLMLRNALIKIYPAPDLSCQVTGSEVGT